MDWNDGNPIDNHILNIENTKGRCDASEKGSFGEIHSGTDPTCIPKTYVAWDPVELPFLERKRIKFNRIGISLGSCNIFLGNQEKYEPANYDLECKHGI